MFRPMERVYAQSLFKLAGALLQYTLITESNSQSVSPLLTSSFNPAKFRQREARNNLHQAVPEIDTQ